MGQLGGSEWRPRINPALLSSSTGEQQPLIEIGRRVGEKKKG